MSDVLIDSATAPYAADAYAEGTRRSNTTAAGNMTERVMALRQASLETKPRLSLERARLITAYYRTAPAESVPMQRAHAFQYLLEHKTIYIGTDELIVGERGPLPKSTPTYPELCCHTMPDLAVLNAREKISYQVDLEAERSQREDIIPFWQG